MNLQEAAKFLIVAWVKDWPLRTLLDTITNTRGEVTEDRIALARQSFLFLPMHIHWYVCAHGAGASTRRFVADGFPRLNDALWDADDNKGRLELSSRVETLDASDIRMSRQLSRDGVAAMRKAKSEFGRTMGSYRLSREAFKTHQRSAWNVCK